MSPLRILWYPKLYREVLENPNKIFATSTRMRAYNFHQGIKDKPDIKSEILGWPNKSFFPWKHDVLVIQKRIPTGSLAFQLCLSPNLFVVQDLCDPIRADLAQQIHKYANLIITSNHELTNDVIKKGARIPVVTVLDNHDANPNRVKIHEKKDRMRVSWYGIGENYYWHIKPMQDVFSQAFVDFRWTSGEDPKWKNEWAFQNGVKMEMDPEEAWRRADSWQEFIFQTDVGVVPVMEHIKSPHKILNYMAYGIPVICTPTDSHSRIVRHGENGFLAKDREDWIKYLDILRNPETRAAMGKKARETALVAYSLQSISDQYLETIRSHLHQKKLGVSTLGKKIQYAASHLRYSSVDS